MTKAGDRAGEVRGARRALVLLTIVYALNYMDRQVLGILVGPIKAELHFTDTELGLLGGLAFALFYATLAVPIARIADRFDRVWVTTVSLGVWSAFTALCGLATGFTGLFAARMGVGVGESGGVAPSLAMISDLFPPTRRARMFGLFYLGIPLGSAAGVLFGGFIAARIDWRTAFFVLGAIGLLLAPVLRLSAADPGARRFTPDAVARPSFMQVLRLLWQRPSFWLMAFGSGVTAMISIGISFWTPSVLERSFHMGLETRALYYAAIILAAAPGIWLAGLLGDRAAARHGGGYARVPMWGSFAAGPIFALAFHLDSPALAFPLFVIATALSQFWLGTCHAAAQAMVPPSMRATTAAMFLFVSNMIGFGLGAWFLGAVSDLLAARGGESLRGAIFIGLPLFWAAAGLFWFAARRLARDLASGGDEAG